MQTDAASVIEVRADGDRPNGPRSAGAAAQAECHPPRPDWAGLTVTAPDDLGAGLAACRLSLPSSCDGVARRDVDVRVFQVGGQLVAVGLARDLAVWHRQAKEFGAADATAPVFTRASATVRTRGWLVTISLDPTDPRHCWLTPRRKPWDGQIHATRRSWPSWRLRLEVAGVAWTGDDPAQEADAASRLDADAVPGWFSPAPNGFRLHEYQRDGARFCARRDSRALIGDEMGVGKTAQAIAVAEGIHAARVFIVCPPSARFVWEREIQGWGAAGRIQHVASSLDPVDLGARWHILSYDQIAGRSATWMLRDQAEAAAFAAAFPQQRDVVLPAGGGTYPMKVAVSEVPALAPAFAPDRAAAWARVMRRLRGELLEQIVAEGGDALLIVDEAHRVKNPLAKRTAAVRRLAGALPGLLMLTGTPLRNNEHEAKFLLSMIDKGLGEALGQHYTAEDVRDALGYVMIRRTKAEVLPELPAKTYQRVDVARLDQGEMAAYDQALKRAFSAHACAVAAGKSAEAQRVLLGGLERARTALGRAKVAGGDVDELVQGVVESQGCCVVFCAHHAVSDGLLERLRGAGVSAAVVDGRKSLDDRTRLVDAFQSGSLDVLICSINAAGEAITLTRASTVVFVELDWVPAALRQAEDRIHRVGQRSNCQVIHLVARMPGGMNLDQMMTDALRHKEERIGVVLGGGRKSAAHRQSIRGEVVSALVVSIKSVETNHPGSVLPAPVQGPASQRRGDFRRLSGMATVAPAAAPPSRLLQPFVPCGHRLGSSASDPAPQGGTPTRGGRKGPGQHRQGEHAWT